MKPDDLDNIVVPLRLHRDEWMALLEILEFAQLTYSGIANKTIAEGELALATNAAVMSEEARVLINRLQKAGLNTIMPAN